MTDFMSILTKRILKTLLKIDDGFCVMVDIPYELFVLVRPELVYTLAQARLSETLPRGRAEAKD